MPPTAPRGSLAEQADPPRAEQDSLSVLVAGQSGRQDGSEAAAQTRGSRGREGGAAHLGQVRGGDSPGDGGRCGPAQRPGRGRTLASRFAPAGWLVFQKVLRSALWGRGRWAWGQGPNRPYQPGLAWCPRDSSEIPPPPGAPAAVLALGPSSSSSSRKAAVTLPLTGAGTPHFSVESGRLLHSRPFPIWTCFPANPVVVQWISQVPPFSTSGTAAGVRLPCPPLLPEFVQMPVH